MEVLSRDIGDDSYLISNSSTLCWAYITIELQLPFPFLLSAENAKLSESSLKEHQLELNK